MKQKDFANLGKYTRPDVWPGFKKVNFICGDKKMKNLMVVICVFRAVLCGTQRAANLLLNSGLKQMAAWRSDCCQWAETLEGAATGVKAGRIMPGNWVWQWTGGVMEELAASIRMSP
jgi:hypothetical protein